MAPEPAAPLAGGAEGSLIDVEPAVPDGRISDVVRVRIELGGS